jgi:hypothetical protein
MEINPGSTELSPNPGLSSRTGARAGRVCRWLLVASIVATLAELFIVDDSFRVELDLGSWAIPVYGSFSSLGLTFAAGLAFSVWLFAVRRRFLAISSANDLRIAGTVTVLLFLAWIGTTALLSEPAEIALPNSAGVPWQVFLVDTIGIGAAISAFVFIGRADRLVIAAAGRGSIGPHDDV